MWLFYPVVIARDNERSFFVDFGIMPQETSASAAAPTVAATSAAANTVSWKPLFDQALALQQQKNWDVSLQTYRQLLDQGLYGLSAPQAAVVYHNMSTVAYEKGDLLHAYVWSKKALTLNPLNQLVRDSFSHYATEFQVPSVPRQISNYDHFKAMVTVLPADVWLVLSVALILITCWLGLRNVLLNKKSQLAETFTRSPRWPVWVAGFSTLVVFSVSYISYQESQISRAVVTAAPAAAVQTAPGENMPVIFQAPAGLELEVLKADQGFLQVRHPGAFSGWVRQSDLEPLSLSFGH